MCKLREESRIAEEADINGGNSPYYCARPVLLGLYGESPLLLSLQEPLDLHLPLIDPARWNTEYHFVIIFCAPLYAIFMKQKTQHINIETVITQFIFMMRLIKWIRLELWSLIHWFSYTAWEMFSLTLFPGFPLRPAGPGNPRGPLKEKNKKQRERWF